MSDLMSVVNSYSQINKVRTASSPVTPIEVAENKQREKQKTMNKTAVLSGAALLTAAAATGIYLVMRGKAQKAKQLQEELQKQFSKFEQGKAIANSGEPFSGQITKELKDGIKVLLDYEKGILKQSTKFKDEKQISKKVYTYNEQGKLEKITNGAKYTEKNLLAKYKNAKGFDVVRNTHGTIYTNKQTNEVIYNFSKSKDSRAIKYFKDGKLQYEVDGRVEKFYKEDGKTVDFYKEGSKWFDSDGVSYLHANGFEGVNRHNCDSTYDFSYNFVKSRADSLRVPERYLNNSPVPQGIPKHKNKNLAGWLNNQYALNFRNTAGKKTETVYLNFSKNLLVKGNEKRTFDEANVLLRRPDGVKVFDLVENIGNIHIKCNDGIDTVFNPKTNTFENLNMPEEQAKEVLDYVEKAFKQLKKDRKDYFKMEKLQSKMFELQEHIRDIEYSHKV